VVLCTCCTCSTGVHAVVCAYHTCCVVYIWYYVCAWCTRDIMKRVFVAFYSVYVYVLGSTSGVGVCIMFLCTLDVGPCTVLGCTLGVGVCVICKV